MVCDGAKGLLLLLKAGIDSGNTTPGSVELSIIGGNAMVLTVDQKKGRGGLSICGTQGDPSNTAKIMKISKKIS